MRDEILLNGVKYRIAKGRDGQPLVKFRPRASQPGDPGDLVVAEWQTWGPDFNSFEQIDPGGSAGYLGRDYGQNTDGRWYGLDQLGPQINTITLSTHDADNDIVEDAHAQTEVEAWATRYAYIARGTRPAKVDLSDMTLKDGGASLNRPITDLVTTVAAQTETVLTFTGSLTDNTNLDFNTGIAVSADGNYVYIANTGTGNERLTVVDVSDPTQPTVVGSVQDATALDGAAGVAVSADGNYVYVAADFSDRLVVVDVSDPANPSIAGSVTDAVLEGAVDVAVSADGDYVYVAAGDADRLVVVDVSTPATPSVAGSVTDAVLNGAFAVSVSADGDYAYVTAISADRLVVVDVTTPSSPSVAGSVTDAALNGANRVVTSSDGSHAIVTAFNDDRLVMVDVSTPSSPSITGSVQDTTDLDGPADLTLSESGDYVYVACQTGSSVTIVDVSTPASPVVVGTVSSATRQLANSGYIARSSAGGFVIVGGFGTDTIYVLKFATLEVSAGQGDVEGYQVLGVMDIGDPSDSQADTWAENSSGQAARSFGVAPDRIVGMSKNVVKGNILTGAVTMASPNWNTVATLTGQQIDLRLNGFALDGSLWIISTSNGPWMLDRETLDFFPLIPEVDNHDDNGKNAGNWTFLGAIIPLQRTLRFLRNLAGESFGPEVFEGNTSPVQGHTHGFAGSERWGYAVFHNTTTGDSYLAACRPREPGDPHLHPVSWFTLAKLTGVHSEYVRYIGTANGLRTNPTVMGGYDDDCFWFIEGRTAREIDDSNYRNATSGTTYLTELRRQPGVLKDIEAVEFESDNCTANQTITVAVSLDGGTAQTFSTVTSDGHHRLYAVDGNGDPDSDFHGGRRIKPEIRYASNVATASPQVVGTLRLYYRIRPLTVRVWDVPLVLDDEGSRTAEEREEALYALVKSNGPVEVENWENDTLYVRVEVIEAEPQRDRGGGEDSSRQLVRQATVRLTEWLTA